jgi:hypothetical protein
MDIGHPIAAGSLAAIFIQDLQSPVAVVRSTTGSKIAVGNWGDGSVRRYRYGAAR